MMRMSIPFIIVSMKKLKKRRRNFSKIISSSLLEAFVRWKIVLMLCTVVFNASLQHVLL